MYRSSWRQKYPVTEVRSDHPRSYLTVRLVTAYSSRDFSGSKVGDSNSGSAKLNVSWPPALTRCRNTDGVMVRRSVGRHSTEARMTLVSTLLIFVSTITP